MARLQSVVAQPRSWAALPRGSRIAVAAVTALAFWAVAYSANRDIARGVDRQIAQDEDAFCRKVTAGAQYTSCMQEVPQLLQRVQDAQASEF